MNDHIREGQVRDARRKLSDYPISLRQSARAVFGSAYAREEQSDQHPAADDRRPDASRLIRP